MWKKLKQMLGNGIKSRIEVSRGCSADDLNKYFVATPDHPTMLSCDSSQATSTVTRQSNALRLSATGQNDVFRFRPIKRDDVLTHLQNLNESKATGLDGISAKLLKLSAPAIAQDLCDIFNHSLTTSQIPACWKEAKVTPIPKVLGASSPEQFRPISVIPVVARVFESLVFQQLYSYVSGSGLLHWAQSGFRPHHCTQDVLLKVTDDWRASIDRNEVVGAVFLDLRKAFDSINHNLLLHKLHVYGVRGEELLWFQSYLSDRRQRVLAGSVMSSGQPISHGVPQGSVLGPLLFSLFVNEIPNIVKHSKVMLYADDTTIYHAAKVTSRLEAELNEDIHLLSMWLCNNDLNINTEKTKWMFFSRKGRQTESQHLQFNVLGRPLSRCDTFKYLGVILDSQLSWKDHIQSVRKKCMSTLSVIAKISKCLPLAIKKTLYLSLVQPHLDYCCVVWSECNKSDSLKLDRIQKMGMRLILNADRRSPSDLLRKRLTWTNLAIRRKIMRLKVVRRCTSGEAPVYLSQMFKTNQQLNYRSARRPHDFYLPTFKTNQGAKSFVSLGGQDWNSLVQSARMLRGRVFLNYLYRLYS